MQTWYVVISTDMMRIVIRRGAGSVARGPRATQREGIPAVEPGAVVDEAAGQAVERLRQHVHGDGAGLHDAGTHVGAAGALAFRWKGRACGRRRRATEPLVIMKVPSGSLRMAMLVTPDGVRLIDTTSNCGPEMVSDCARG